MVDRVRVRLDLGLVYKYSVIFRDLKHFAISELTSLRVDQSAT